MGFTRSSLFIQTDMELIRLDRVERIDLSQFAELGEVTVYHAHGSSVARGVYAIEALLLLKPSALEGAAVRWIRHAWLIHNLVGHPLMQLLALCGWRKAALWIHDTTVPGRSKLRPS